MTPARRKTVLTIFTLLCVMGATVSIYVGHDLFRNRPSIFWVFSAYIILLTAIVIFFGFKLIGTNASKEN